MRDIVVVTGGSRGIGAATAEYLGSQGWAVAVNFTANPEPAQSVVSRIRAAGGKALAVRADVSKEDDVMRMFEEVDRDLGHLTGLVNCAGSAGQAGLVRDVVGTDLLRLLEVNVVGTLLCCREAVRRMARSTGGGGGAIVNLSSVAARLGAPNGGVPYAASKGAIDSLTFGLAQEVACEGIRVNAVRPGVIDTDMQPPGRVAAIAPSLPMRRAGNALEVAHAVAWLMRPEASYVAGAVLDVSGGR